MKNVHLSVDLLLSCHASRAELINCLPGKSRILFIKDLILEKNVVVFEYKMVIQLQKLELLEQNQQQNYFSSHRGRHGFYNPQISSSVFKLLVVTSLQIIT